ncbi:MAG: hypothetical protein ABR543_01030 [Gemmatimonadaceae bacterium]
MAARTVHRLSYREGEGKHSYGELYRRLQLAIDAVRLRTRVDTSSRVARWLAALSRLAAVERRSVLEHMVVSLRRGSWHHPYRDSFRALADSRMFIEIVEQLLPDVSDRDLRDLVLGNSDPALDKPSTRARDREFELFVAAISRRSGLAVELNEPDIVLRLNNSTRSIAAKRLLSPKKVEENVKKATKQIEKAGHPGFIFLDVTRILDPGCLIVTHWTRADQTVGGHLLCFINTEHREDLVRKRGEYVRGIVLHSAFPHVSPNFQYGTYETWWGVPVEGTDGQEVNALLDHLLLGLNDT